MCQLWKPQLDLGQMIAELYELYLYKKIDAWLWLIEGFLAGYGFVDDDLAFRTSCMWAHTSWALGLLYLDGEILSQQAPSFRLERTSSFRLPKRTESGSKPTTWPLSSGQIGPDM